jgi:hypothetical protein
MIEATRGLIPAAQSAPVIPPTSFVRKTQRGPSMYEMEGPRGLTARTGRLLGRPALRGQPPVPETRLKRRLPGSSSVPEFPPVGSRFRSPTAGAEDPPKVPVTRLFQRSGVAPGWSPFPTVKAFLLLHAKSHKGYPPVISRFFGRPHRVHRMCALIHRRPALFHRAVHKIIHNRSAASARRRLGVADVRDDCVKGLQHVVSGRRDGEAVLPGAECDGPSLGRK